MREGLDPDFLGIVRLIYLEILQLEGGLGQEHKGVLHCPMTLTEIRTARLPQATWMKQTGLSLQTFTKSFKVHSRQKEDDNLETIIKR